MSDSEPKKGYNTNPLDKRVAERAEAEMGEGDGPDVDSEAPTREMHQEPVPVAGGPTHGISDTAPQRGADTSAVGDTPSGPVANPTGGMYTPPGPDPRPYAAAPQDARPYAPFAAADPRPFAQPPQGPPSYPQWQGQAPPQTGPYPGRATGGFEGFKAEGAAALGLKPNFAAMAAYTPFIGGLVSLLLVVMEPPRNRFVRFHAKQALIGHVCFWAIVTALRIAINNAPGPLGVLLMFPQIAIYLGYMIGFISMMAKAYNSERFKIPIIGEQAE